MYKPSILGYLYFWKHPVKEIVPGSSTVKLAQMGMWRCLQQCHGDGGVQHHHRVWGLSWGPALKNRGAFLEVPRWKWIKWRNWKMIPAIKMQLKCGDSLWGCKSWNMVQSATPQIQFWGEYIHRYHMRIRTSISFCETLVFILYHLRCLYFDSFLWNLRFWHLWCFSDIRRSCWYCQMLLYLLIEHDKYTEYWCKMTVFYKK